MPSSGDTEWFTKGYSVYGSADDDDYYLGLGKDAVMHSKVDILAVKLLSKNYSFLSWDLVASAIPPIRHTGGARTFVGSRGSSVDTAFSDSGEDASGYGFPPALAYVFNLTNIAEGGSAIQDANKYVNYSGMADGLVGGELPAVIFYYPVAYGSPYLPNNTTGHRYWTMVAVGTPDMQGSREQGRPTRSMPCCSFEWVRVHVRVTVQMQESGLGWRLNQGYIGVEVGLHFGLKRKQVLAQTFNPKPDPEHTPRRMVSVPAARVRWA